MDFIKWYKNIVESGNEEPPSQVWEDIQDELDIDIVWQNIQTDLPGSKRRTMYYRLAAAASFLLLIGFGTLLFYDGLKETAPEAYVIDAYEPDDSDTLQPIRRQTESKVQVASIEADHDTLATTKHLKDTIEKLPDTEIIKEPEEEIEPFPILAYQPAISVTTPTIKSTEKKYFVSTQDIQTEETARVIDNYYVGLSGHAANTWLLNNKTIQGMQKDNLTATLPSFGYNFGIIAGKHLNKNISIQSEIYVISQNRQSYNEYIHGQYVNSNLEFNYSSYTISGRWQFMESENQGKHSLVMGAYTGILRNATQNINGSSISLKDEYNSIDYGLIAGYEYNHEIWDNLTLGTGVQTKYGLKNIFSGNEYIPDYFNSTRNMSINFILSVKYDFN